jgi:hypothetical protein
MAGDKLMARFTQVSGNKDVGFLRRTLGGAAQRAIEGLEYITGQKALQDLARREIEAAPEGSPKKNIKVGSFSESIGGLFGTPEQLKPQGFAEEALQLGLSQAPLAAAGGFAGAGAKGAASAIGRTLLGATAATTAKAAGLPEWAQTAAQIGTELGASAIGNSMGGLNKYKSSLYEEARQSLRPSETGASGPIKTVLKDIDKLHKIEVNDKVRAAIYDIGNVIENNIDKYGKIDIRNAWDIRSSIYDLMKEGTIPRASKKYLNSITKGINEVLQEHGNLNPRFWNSLSSADQIHTAQNMKSVVSKFIDKTVPKTGFGKIDSLVRKSFPLAAIVKPNPATILPIIAHASERAIQYLSKPAVRNYFGKVAMAAAEENLPQLIKYGGKLNDVVSKEKPKSRFTKVS